MNVCNVLKIGHGTCIMYLHTVDTIKSVNAPIEETKFTTFKTEPSSDFENDHLDSYNAVVEPKADFCKFSKTAYVHRIFSYYILIVMSI